jgi:hypothetical protein
MGSTTGAGSDGGSTGASTRTRVCRSKHG